MYKAEYTSTGEIKKSHNIVEVCSHVIENPTPNIQFYVGYKPYSKSDFLKLFLQELNDYDKYIVLYTSIFTPLNIFDYASR